jgi:hypothetical protein
VPLILTADLSLEQHALVLLQRCREFARHRFNEASEPNADSHAIIEMSPRAYDAQKATRITLFHALLSYVLGRIWQAANPTDKEFATLMARLGMALGKSRYLDGHQTDWSQQFWAMVWERDGGTILE